MTKNKIADLETSLFEELSDAELMAVVGGFTLDLIAKPCVGLPAKANVQSVLALVNVGVQDIPVLSSPQNQQCLENSTQAKGDEPLSYILDNIPVLSGNGSVGS
ncbi:rodlin [Nostoc sp. 'Peltigera membranacea cyanobiont' 210A]|uniref:rodlin n=1 Tax=Nostoc sp. 'Peltigera membranacea cyanobiont' 210A TaxID=2014529 RepID=UPI001CB94D61|nr:rodlin [Nostoc sp. 'Peltigera membranacea cyanobiont' 210A]